MARPVNEQVRQARTAEILAVARERLTNEGLAGFSLRSVARELQLAPNAIYNYYPCLDNLITALLVDAFERFAEALEGAVVATQSAPTAQRFAAVCVAYREWAIGNHVDYDLMFGNPLPDYHAPAAVTSPLVLRALRAGLNVLVTAWRVGELHIPSHYESVPAAALPHLATLIYNDEHDVPPAVYGLMLLIWSRLHGLVSLENNGRLEHPIGATEAWYRYTVDALLGEIGLIGYGSNQH